MTKIFKRNAHIDDFEAVFGNNEEGDIWNGSQKIINLSIDMQSQYLQDKTSDTARAFWYVVYLQSLKILCDRFS